MVPILIGLVVPAIPLRSMYYLPIYSLVLFKMVSQELRIRVSWRAPLKKVAIVFLAVTIMNNAVVIARLGQISNFNFDSDRQLVQTIKQMTLESEPPTQIRIYGAIKLSGSPMSLREPESIGNSVFSSSNVYRVALFLKYFGLDFTPSVNSPEDEIVFDSMEGYPFSNWLDIRNGSLYLKLGE
jgi:hypothetical protein